MTAKLTLIPITKAFGEALDALAELPVTPSGIAAALEEAGITGDRKRPETCALANYIRHKVELPERTWLSVAMGKIHIGQYATEHTYILPPGLTAFTLNFDRGDYPDLIMVASADAD